MGKYRQIMLLLAGALFFFLLGGIVLSKSFLNSKLQNQSVLTQDVKSIITESSNNPVGDNGKLIKVERVVDGDTIVLEGGKVLRYIGIDTPETKDPRESIQCFGVKASEENKKLVEGKLVRLEKDISETDRYGRLLRYVYVNNVFINDYLVKEGYAHASSYPPDIKYQSQFSASEKEARTLNKGLWSECGSSISQTAIQTPTPSSATTIQDTTNIDCSKNAYNCTSFQKQSEAQNVFDTCGGISNDIHKLDRDGDGRVCETLP